jgi:hypothetical protein
MLESHVVVITILLLVNRLYLTVLLNLFTTHSLASYVNIRFVRRRISDKSVLAEAAVRTACFVVMRINSVRDWTVITCHSLELGL